MTQETTRCTIKSSHDKLPTTVRVRKTCSAEATARGAALYVEDPELAKTKPLTTAPKTRQIAQFGRLKSQSSFERSTGSRRATEHLLGGAEEERRGERVEVLLRCEEQRVVDRRDRQVAGSGAGT